MKTNIDNVQPQQQVQQDDLTELFYSLQEQYEEVYIEHIERQMFIIKPLGRLEYKQIINNKEISDLEKEEVICQISTLWPTDFDFENCIGGIPTTLANLILRDSYLNNIESRTSITLAFREEMFDLDNQVTCIIHEAFPDLQLEDIESWRVSKTAKYLSRAEWILYNLRGANIDNVAQEPQVQPDPQQPVRKSVMKTEEIGVQTKPQKEKMTPEKLMEMKRKFPDIDWDAQVSMDDFKHNSFDTTPPALRTPQ